MLEDLPRVKNWSENFPAHCREKISLKTARVSHLVVASPSIDDLVNGG